MSTPIVPSTIHEMITLSASRSLQTDWDLAAAGSRLRADIGANDPTRWQKADARTWLDVAHIAIREPAAPRN